MMSSSATDSADEPCASTDIPLEDSYKITKLVSDLTALIDSIEDEYTRLTLKIRLEELKFERIRLLSLLVENRGSESWRSVRSGVIIASKELILHLTELLVQVKTYQTAERKISLKNSKRKETRKRLRNCSPENCKNCDEFAKRAKLCAEEHASSSSTEGCRSHLERPCRLAKDLLRSVTSDVTKKKDNTSSMKKKPATSSIPDSKNKKPATKLKQQTAKAKNTSIRMPILQITPLKINKDLKLKGKKQKENSLGPFSFFCDTNEPCSSQKIVKRTEDIKDLRANKKTTKKVSASKDKNLGKIKANVDKTVKGTSEAKNADKNVAYNENTIVIPSESTNATPITENDIWSSLDDTKVLKVEHIEIIDLDNPEDDESKTTPIQLCSNNNSVISNVRQTDKKEVTNITETVAKQVKSVNQNSQPSDETPKCLNSYLKEEPLLEENINDDAKNKDAVTLDKTEKNSLSLHNSNSIVPGDTKNNEDKPCKKSVQNSMDDKSEKICQQPALDNDLAEKPGCKEGDNLDSKKDSFFNITNKTLPTKEMILAGNSSIDIKKEESDKYDTRKNPGNQKIDKFTPAENTVSSPIVQKIMATKKTISQEKQIEKPHIGIKNRIIIEPEMLVVPQQKNLKERDNEFNCEVDCQVGEHDAESKTEAQKETCNLSILKKKDNGSNERLTTNSLQCDTTVKSCDSTDKASKAIGASNDSSASEQSVRLYYPEDDPNKKVQKCLVVDHVDLPEVSLGTQQVQNKRRIVLKRQVDKSDTNKKKDTDATMPERNFEETEQALTLTIQKSVEKDKDLFKDYLSAQKPRTDSRTTVFRPIENIKPLVPVKKPIESHSKQIRAPEKNIKKSEINKNQKKRGLNKYGYYGGTRRGYADYCDDYYRRCTRGTESTEYRRPGYEHSNNKNRSHADFRQSAHDMPRNDINTTSREIKESTNQVFRHIMNEKNVKREFDNHSLCSAVTVKLNDFHKK